MLALAAAAQGSHFVPDHLAVLRAGDGAYKLVLKQSPIFIDQFDPGASNVAPSFTVRIPTNGPDSFFFNGHAASEGNLTRSVNHKLLAFAGYGGMDLLQVNGTASRLNIPHGFATVDAAGGVHSFTYKSDRPEVKVNPRGVITDGSNDFWGCGNAFGTYYYNPVTGGDLVRFHALPSTRAINIINDVLYVSLNGADASLGEQPAGVYNFDGAARPRQADAPAKLVIEAAPDYQKVAGFEINPAEDVAYLADTSAGVQKYVKNGGKWTFVYNISIPQTIPKELNNAAGCFGLVVDFTRAAPVIFATTTEGYGGSVNANRLVRIVDTNSTPAVVTIAQAGSTNIAFRGLAFTPD